MKGGATELSSRVRFLLRKVDKAVRDYKLIEDGDRIAVAVSGGKDSLVLLHLLVRRRALVPERYEVIALNVRTDYPCGAPRKVLEPIFRREGVPFSFEEISLKEGSKGNPLNCFWCSWNRRKALFLAAHRLGCNKIAFAHHADDAIVTFLLNLFNHGRAEGMSPRVEFFGGLLTLIRPLIYLEEREIARFARVAGLVLELVPCPLAGSTQRDKLKDLVRTLEREFPQLKANLLRASLKSAAEARTPA